MAQHCQHIVLLSWLVTSVIVTGTVMNLRPVSVRCFYRKNRSSTVFTGQKEGDGADSAANGMKNNSYFNGVSQRGMPKVISSVVALSLPQYFPSFYSISSLKLLFFIALSATHMFLSVFSSSKIQSGRKLVLAINTEACQGKDNFVRYLEHVQAVVTVNASRRGDLSINMTSPMGTKSILLSRRPRDDDAKVGFDKWPFMTTHTWGEDPRGTWLLEVGFHGKEPQHGVLKEWTLMLHGTQSAPYIEQIVRDYKSKLAMSKKEELEEELDEAVERSLKSLLSKNN